MKAPGKPTTPRKPKTGKQISTPSSSQFLDFATSSVDAFKAFAEMRKEEQATTRTQMQAQRDILIGEQGLAKARIEQETRLAELQKEDLADQRRHQVAMDRLVLDNCKLVEQAEKNQWVLDELKAGTISGETAVELIGALAKE